MHSLRRRTAPATADGRRKGQTSHQGNFSRHCITRRSPKLGPRPESPIWLRSAPPRHPRLTTRAREDGIGRCWGHNSIATKIRHGKGSVQSSHFPWLRPRIPAADVQATGFRAQLTHSIAMVSRPSSRASVVPLLRSKLTVRTVRFALISN